MGWGLGKNTPIVLSLGRGNYEAMLERHGQNVRWRVMKKCHCTADGSNQPDVNCPLCGGNGERYDYQKDFTDTMRIRCENGMVELPLENVNCEVLRAYDAIGVEYTPSQMGQYVQLFSPVRELNNGEVVELVYRQPLTEIIEEARLEPVGNGYYRVPGVLSDMSTLEGVDYRAPGDIQEIGSIFDDSGEEVDIIEYRQDTVRLKDEGKARPFTAFGVKYIKPFKFFVLAQNFDDEDEKLLAIHEGDAISTFPYHFDVSEGDVITVLTGHNTKKVVLKRNKAGADDTLMEFFVGKVTYLATNVREYREGIDFIIAGANKIHWVCTDPPRPGVNMSITYQYFMTYRVAKGSPISRTSENQKIPRKVILTLFSGFTERRGVNRNG